MGALPLELFPTSGFDSSATTPVLLGVLVSWFFTETLGWVFGGLVVPGYLAGVFVLDARAGAIDVVEAVLTFVLAKTIDEVLPRAGLTFRAFGRERFFLVIVSSIVVRLVMDAILLPRVFPDASWAFSFGLVLVPLLANACWKTGLFSGLLQSGVRTAIVYALLRFVLFRYTNLSLSGFQLATENVAATFLDSPKAYILLLTGAALAAAANVKFGWDYGGILIPALLTLVFVDPIKFAATFVEALALIVLASLVLRTLRATPLAQVNVEGPRRVVLFFTIDYALRFTFATVAARALSGNDVVEMMGFGYLLPTLLAVKASQHGSAARVLLPALEVSSAGFVVGSLLGFSASRFDWRPPPSSGAEGEPASAPRSVAGATLWASALALQDEARRLEGPRLDPSRLASMVDAIATAAEPPSGAGSAFAIQRLDGGALLVRERFGAFDERRAYPTVLIASKRKPEPRLVMLVRHPLSAPMIAAVAGMFADQALVDAVVLAGADQEQRDQEESYAGLVANALALVHTGDKSAGTVLEIHDTSGSVVAHVGAASAKNSRLDDLLRVLRQRSGDLTLARDGSDRAVAIDLSPASMERLLGPRTDEPVALGSPTALALAFDALRPFAGMPSAKPEDLLVLRRLLLEPLLVARDAPFAPLLRRSADALGYRVLGPTRLDGNDQALLLLPAQDPRALAVFARTGGPHAFAVEIEQGHHPRLRDVGARLATVLDVDSILLNLEPSSSPHATEGMRALHSAALASAAGALVIVREAPPDADGAGVTVGTWGGGARDAAAAAVTRALTGLGWQVTERPPDEPLRLLAGRRPHEDRPLVFVTMPPDQLETASLRSERKASELASGVGLPVRDGDVPTTVAAMAQELSNSTAADDVAPNLPQIVASAAVEESVSCYRALALAARSAGARAAVVRSKHGVFLVAVARMARRFIASAAAVGDRSPDTRPSVAASLKECASRVGAGGTCYAAVR
jgi:hypothetical protein